MKRRKISEKEAFELFLKDQELFDLLDNADLERAIFYFNDCIAAEVEYIQNFVKEHKIDCKLITNMTPEAYLIGGVCMDGYSLQIILL